MRRGSDLYDLHVLEGVGDALRRKGVHPEFRCAGYVELLQNLCGNYRMVVFGNTGEDHSGAGLSFPVFSIQPTKQHVRIQEDPRHDADPPAAGLALRVRTGPVHQLEGLIQPLLG